MFYPTQTCALLLSVTCPQKIKTVPFVTRGCPESLSGPAEQVLPYLHDIQQESAWPAIVAGHLLEHWPLFMGPKSHHEDLVFLTSEKALSDEVAQALHSFYSFLLVGPMR